MANRPARAAATPGAARTWSADWHLAAPGGRLPAIPAGLSEAEAARLAELARGASVLEVGSAFGYSTIVAAQVARRVTAVDPHRLLDSLKGFWANLIAHNVHHRVEVLVGESRDVLPQLQVAGRRFEVVFIDGDHAPAAVRFDALWARSLVTQNGAIAFHDYHCERADPVYQGLEGWGEPDELVERLAVYRRWWPA